MQEEQCEMQEGDRICKKNSVKCKKEIESARRTMRTARMPERYCKKSNPFTLGNPFLPKVAQ